MFRGERGRTGDHGQDGRQGERGLPGSSDPDEFEQHVANVTGRSLAAHEKLLRVTDRRIAYLALFIVFAIALAFFLDDRNDDAFRRQIVGTCQATNDGNMKVNELLATLRANALTSPVRTPEERLRIAETYEGLKLPVVQCPPL